MHGAVERLTSHNSDGISPLHGFSHASPRGVYSRVESDRQLIRSARLRGNLVAGSKVGSWPTVSIAASVAMILPLVPMRWIPVLDDLADRSSPRSRLDLAASTPDPFLPSRPPP